VAADSRAHQLRPQTREQTLLSAEGAGGVVDSEPQAGQGVGEGLDLLLLRQDRGVGRRDGSLQRGGLLQEAVLWLWRVAS
jgi:hypothetical protein